MSQFIPAAEDWLISNTSIPPDRCHALAETVGILLSNISRTTQKIVAISGPPGTGKSTIANACAAALEHDRLSSLVISLDDYYLPKHQRGKLSQTEHPLFSARGVPGTHEIELLVGHLELLSQAEHPDIELPRFDKSLDDRADEARVIRSGRSPSFILIEGWVAGVPPQASGALLNPVNDLEAREDRDGEWRSRVNAHLYDYFHLMNPFLDQRWYLDTADWDSVINWRLHQEKDLQQGILQDHQAVAEFLAHFQRICLHMHSSCHEWADVIIQLDADHVPNIVRSQ